MATHTVDPTTACCLCGRCIRDFPSLVLYVPPCYHVQCEECTYRHHSGDRCAECMIVYRYPGTTSRAHTQAQGPAKAPTPTPTPTPAQKPTQGVLSRPPKFLSLAATTTNGDGGDTTSCEDSDRVSSSADATPSTASPYIIGDSGDDGMNGMDAHTAAFVGNFHGHLGGGKIEISYLAAKHRMEEGVPRLPSTRSRRTRRK